MANPTFPNQLLNQLFDKLGTFEPPSWVVDEMQHRLVLLLNHVLMQEPQAQARLQRQQGRVMLAQWRSFAIKLEATPAGLLDRAKPLARPDLTLTVTQASPFAVAMAAMNGEKPSVSIEGDVQLAAEVNWLVEHVRWDLEDDLSRIIGDVPAHALSDAVRRMAKAVGTFAGAAPTEKGGP